MTYKSVDNNQIVNINFNKFIKTYSGLLEKGYDIPAVRRKLSCSDVPLCQTRDRR